MSQPSRRHRAPKAPIGWREWVAFPDIDVEAIKAKIDTGARTSALHAYRLHMAKDESTVRFEVHPLQRKKTPAIPVELPIAGFRRIRSSNGQQQRRPVVHLDVEAGGERWEIEVTLTSRDAMGFRLLLGRSAIAGRFMVDVSKSYLLGRPESPYSGM
jgi:hypothetical protein